MKTKKITSILLASALSVGCAFAMTACDDSSSAGNDSALLDEIAKLEQQLSDVQKDLSDLKKANETPAEDTVWNFGAESYEKLKYIDAGLSDRDCFDGKHFKYTQNWISYTLKNAGYTNDDISYQDVAISTRSTYALKGLKQSALNKLYPAAASVQYSDDGKSYEQQENSWGGYKYVESETGSYAKVNVISQNIEVTKQGKSNKQIIVGMHYDGTGTGDNGSGIALGLTTAEKFHDVETQFTIKFVFFTAEEYGLYGSSAYAAGMTEEDKANTLYMINIDSIVCGDYCYLYGGVQNDEAKTVTKTEAYDNASAVAKSLGLEFKTNPWTWDNPSPDDEGGDPSYASPSTGDWSDHAPFVNAGVTYLYFEATNWEIPDYTGYGESSIVGMLMNTENDYLEFIETYYPGRPLKHLTQFSSLLNALLTQTSWNY